LTCPAARLVRLLVAQPGRCDAPPYVARASGERLAACPGSRPGRSRRGSPRGTVQAVMIMFEGEQSCAVTMIDH
jgi:hypothetical protein